MDNQDVIGRINSILIDKLNVERDELFPESTFEQLGADSLDTVEVQMEIEQEFGITLKDDDVAKLSIIQDLYTIVIKEIEKLVG
ncbi:MAG: acyl carrier protein [Candidatus Woesebacteria bacterium]|nr:acyl carrier protein [Candidatus Woesebacteria bacterium]